MALFLGLELAVDQLRATVVDEQLEIVQAHAVDFDAELGYGTRGGMLGDSQTAPVEMWIKALEVLLGHLSTRVDLSKVRCISGSAMQSTVLWTAESLPALAHLNPSRPLHQQLSTSFSLPAAPLPTCTLSLPHAQAIESLLGGAHAMASLVGTAASSSITAALLLRLRETQPDTWRSTVRVMPASALLASVLLGKWAPASEGEAAGSGLWNARVGGWEGRVVEILASGGGPAEVDRVRRILGEVERSGCARIGTVAPYFIQRFGFHPECALTAFTSDHLSTYLSLAPLPTDAILSFGAQDVLLSAVPPASYSTPQPNIPSQMQSQSPAPMPTANPSYVLLPHPAQHPLDSPRRYIAQHMKRNADVPRALVRDMYTKSWSAFDRLVDVVPPGGSIGLDDKLFSFWLLSPDSYPFTHTKGIFRFETGVKVNEFRDLRANPRTLIEGQIVSLRVGWARVVETLSYSRDLLASSSLAGPGHYFSSSASHHGGFVADPWGQGGGLLRPGLGLGMRTPTRTGGNSPTSGGSPRGGSPLQRPPLPGQLQHRTSVHVVPLLPGVKNPTIVSNIPSSSFDPYDSSRLPPRIIVLGSCAAFPSVVNLVGEIFNANVFVVGDDSASSGLAGSTTPSPAQLQPPHPVSGLLNHHSVGTGLTTPGGNALSAATAAALFGPSNLSLSQHIGPMTPGSAHLGPMTPGGTLLAHQLQGGLLGGADQHIQGVIAAQQQQQQQQQQGQGQGQGQGQEANTAATAPRASLGAAFLARWAWKRSSSGNVTPGGISRVGGTHSPSRYGGSSTPHSKSPSPGPPTSFEEDTRALIAARWATRDKREKWLAHQKEKEEEVTVNIMTPVGGRGRSASAPGFAPNLGALGPLHPHPHHYAKSGLQAEAFAEEEEDEALALEALQAQLGEGAIDAAIVAQPGRGRSATTTVGWGNLTGVAAVGAVPGSYAAAAAGPQTPGASNGYYPSPSTTATSPSTMSGATASPATTVATTPGGFSAYGSPNPLLAGSQQGASSQMGYTGLGIQGMLGGGSAYGSQNFSPFAAGGAGGYMGGGGSGTPGAPPGLQPVLQIPQQPLLTPGQVPTSSSSLLPPQASFSPTSPSTPLPVPQSLPTDDVDKVMGLVKVAEADHDAFMGYAAVVGEWCRLESMLVRGIV